MRIDFIEGSTIQHPNFERYMDESTANGSVPLRFDCVATAAVSMEEIAAKARDELERREKEEQADILVATVVATRTSEPSGHQRFRVLAIARLRSAVPDSTLTRERVDFEGG